MKFQVNKTNSITEFTLYLEKQYKEPKIGFVVETKDSLVETINEVYSYISFNLDKETLDKLKLYNLVFNVDSDRFIKLENLQLKNIYKTFDKDSQLFYRLEGFCTINYINNYEILFYILKALDTMTLEEKSVVASQALDYIKKEKLKSTQA
jgi:hypothetical protein